MFGIWSANKPLDYLPDMEVYQNYYKDILSGYDVIVEPVFYFFTLLLGNINLTFPYLIFIYLLLSLSIKTYVVKFYDGKYKFAFMYLVSYFLLHELIQIRIGLGISFLFLGSHYFFNEKRKYAAFAFLLAILSHFSTIPFVLSFYVSSLVVNRRISLLILLALVISLFMALNGYFYMEIITHIMPSFLQHKLDVYSQIQSVAEEKINLTSIRLLIFYSVLFGLWKVEKKMQEIDRTILLSISCIYILALVTSALPSFSLRFFEICGPFVLFLLARMDLVYNKWLVNGLQLLFVITSIYYSSLLIL
ncbi:EpsG family protein [Aeromonas veronii]